MKNTWSQIETKEVISYSVAVLVFSSLLCYLSFTLGNPKLSIFTVFTPSIVALVITVVTKGKQGVYELFVRQTVRKAAFKWFFLSVFTIPVVASLAVLTSLDLDLSKPFLRTTQLMPQIVVIVLIAIGEEYGWRGFLLPRLMKKFNLFHSNMILGLLWGFWHYPAYLIGTGVPLHMNFMVFLLWVILGSLFIGWIYSYSRSVLTSILIHISANAAFNYLNLLPEFSGNMHAFWIFIIYLSILVGFFYFSKTYDYRST